jgi:hypothetical protein
MENLKQNLIKALIIIAISATFISCNKDITDEFVGTIEISMTETNVLARFVIPKGTKVDKIVIKGTLYRFDDTEQGKVAIMPFRMSGTEINGNYRNVDTNMYAKGEPVTGYEIYIEQEPNDEPLAMTKTDVNNGSFVIEIKNPSTGWYTITVNPHNEKSGFAVGGYSLN